MCNGICHNGTAADRNWVERNYSVRAMWKDDSAKTKASRKAITTANLHNCFMKDVFTKVKTEDIIKEKRRKL